MGNCIFKKILKNFEKFYDRQKKNKTKKIQLQEKNGLIQWDYLMIINNNNNHNHNQHEIIINFNEY